MIDSHCHLDHEPLFSDLSNVIQRSKDIGIEKILTISTSLLSFSKIIDIINHNDIIYGTIGIHPHETSTDSINSNEIVNSLNSNNKIIGVGETGLDFYYNNSEKDKQISSFVEHIEAAIKSNVPLIIHSRNAEKETFDILNQYKNEKLKSQKAIEQLFAEGKSVSAYPLRMVYLDNQSQLKVGVSVSKRNFKLAVHRNRVKRLLREGYRLNKNLLIGFL